MLGRGLVPQRGDPLERLPLVRGVALDGLDEVGDQLVPALELDIHIGPRLAHVGPDAHQPVVDRQHVDQRQEDDHADDDQDDHGRVHGVECTLRGLSGSVAVQQPRKCLGPISYFCESFRLPDRLAVRNTDGVAVIPDLERTETIADR